MYLDFIVCARGFHQKNGISSDTESHPSSTLISVRNALNKSSAVTWRRRIHHRTVPAATTTSLVTWSTRLQYFWMAAAELSGVARRLLSNFNNFPSSLSSFTRVIIMPAIAHTLLLAQLCASFSLGGGGGSGGGYLSTYHQEVPKIVSSLNFIFNFSG